MKLGKQFLQFLLSAGVLVGICAWVGWNELYQALASISLWSFLVLVFYSIALIWISCIKWRLFLREGGGDESIAHLMKLYTIGYFFNLFTPSFVGGDAVRSYKLGTRLGSQRQALVSTFLERFTGLLAMTTLGVIFVCIGTETTHGLEVSILLVGAASFALAAICFSSFFSRLFFSLARSLLARLPFQKKVEKFQMFLGRVDEAFSHARGNPKLLIKALGLSFVYHLFTVGNTYAAAQAVGWENPPIEGLFVVVPLALLVGMVPLTPAGVGIQEGAFLFLLRRIGATEGAGLGVGIVLRAKSVLLGLIGGLIFMGMRDSSKRTNARG